MRIANAGGVVRVVAFLSLFSLGCGPDFDPPSELHSLRVLGVQKDVPYAQPGETVNLQMLWQDASLLAGRDIQVAWSPGCFDPPGDLYYACFAKPEAFGSMVKADPLNPERTSVYITTYIIRPPYLSNKSTYLITYVFLALC